MLDHLLWFVPDLELGSKDLAARCGVRPAIGGKHPGVGTHNALIALQGNSYLEIIAPDPDQTQLTGLGLLLRGLRAPGLLTWAAQTDDLERMGQRARGAGLDPGEILSMSRRRPDGTHLAWRLMQLEGHSWGPLVPFFIQWRDTTRSGTERTLTEHPSRDAPKGCRLASFTIEHPAAVELHSLFAHLELAIDIRTGPTLALSATLDSPRGPVELSGPPNIGSAPS